MRHLFAASMVAAHALTGTAVAAPLVPGGVVFPVGTDATDPVHGGVQTVLNDNLLAFELDPIPMTPFTTVGGKIQNRVTELPSGFLRFAPRIRDTFNLEGGIFAITSLVLTGYGTFATDIEFRTDGSGDKGITSASRSVSGDTMTLRYGDPLLLDGIQPGPMDEGFFNSIVTGATAYDLSGTAEVFGFFIDDDAYDGGLGVFQKGPLVSVAINGLAVPTVAPVPLPASAFLLIAGLAGLGILRRKKKI